MRRSPQTGSGGGTGEVKQRDAGLSTLFGNEAKPRIFLRGRDASIQRLRFVLRIADEAWRVIDGNEAARAFRKTANRNREDRRRRGSHLGFLHRVCHCSVELSRISLTA